MQCVCITAGVAFYAPPAEFHDARASTNVAVSVQTLNMAMFM